MKFRIALFASVLALLPGLAAAACGERSAGMSCADGTVWDPEARACVTVTG